MNKSSVFIGSSSEGVEFARAIRNQLDNDAEITLWTDDFFNLGSTFIETLVTKLPLFDFAILVFTSDDRGQSRDLQMSMPRDNVIFELGLFMGHLGRDRTFLVHEKKDDLKIPTDLSGSITATFRVREDANYNAAVGKASDDIRKIIVSKGPLDKKTSHEIRNIKNRQSTIENSIKTLQIVTKVLVSEFEYEKLRGLAKEGPFMVGFHNDMYEELKRLDAIRYIQPQQGYGLRDIQSRDGRGDEFDLKQYVSITDSGKEYLKLRDELLNS
jgi:Predicted nucleotide-binding protein containing TIR-like domain